MRYQYLLIRTTTPNAGEDAEKLNHSYVAGGNGKLYCGNVKLLRSLAVSYKTKPVNTIWLRNYTFGHLLQRNETLYSYESVYSFICNNLKLKSVHLSLTSEWLNKMWSIHTKEYYSVTKRNRLLIHITTWTNLQEIMLSEKSQSPKVAYHMI